MASNNKKARNFKTTEQLQKTLDGYNRRINQLKIIQLQRRAELDLIMKQPKAWLATQNIGKRTNVADYIEKHKKILSGKVARIDILLMKAEGGKITQSMFDYGGKTNFFGADGKNFMETFNLVKPDGEKYVVGDDYIPTDNDRFTLIENIETIIGNREIEEADNTPSKDFPQITVQDPNNKYKTITIDKEDYLSGTDFRDEQSVLDNRILNELKIKQKQIDSGESKSNLTKQLTIQNF